MQKYKSKGKNTCKERSTNYSEKVGVSSAPTERGFTLIEMIVAVSLFTVVVFVSVGALLAVADANRKANALRTVMDNLSFSLESMNRSIRTGTDYECDGSSNCAAGGNTLTVIDPNGSEITYMFSESNGKGTIVRTKNGGDAINVTTPEIDINDLTFYVRGVGSDSRQPYVVVFISGTAEIIEKLITEFSVQTTVTQRRLES